MNKISTNYRKKFILIFMSILINLQTCLLQADPLHDAVRNNDITTVTELIAAGANVNSLDETLCTEKDIILYWQQYNISNDYMKQMKENSFSHKKFQASEKTALHLAAENNFVEIIKLLMQSGANIDSEDAFHRTPLECAVQYNSLKAAQFLLQYYIPLNGFHCYSRKLLHYAAVINSPQMVQLLIQSGAHIKSCIEGKAGFNIITGTVYGTTPLHAAVIHNSYDAAVALLQAGANKYQKNGDWKTPCDLAQNEKMLKILKHFGKSRSRKRT